MTPSGPENQQSAAQPDSAALHADASVRAVDAIRQILPPGAVDAQGKISIEAFCTGCSYNLRGLLVTGACPECGMQVRNSLDGEQLTSSNKAWLRRVAQGIYITTGGLLLIFVSPYIVWLIGPAALSTGNGFMVFWLPAWLTFLLGMWRMTTPEPRTSYMVQGKPPNDEIRKTVRVALVIGCTCFWMFVAMMLSQPYSSHGVATNNMSPLWALVAAAGCSSPLLILGGLMLLWGYFHKLARRLPGYKSSSGLRTSAVACFASLLPMFVSILFVTCTGITPIRDPTGRVIQIVIELAGLAAAVTLLWLPLWLAWKMLELSKRA